MSKVISGKRLQEAIKNSEFLSGGDTTNCDGIKYDFRLDDCILKAKFGTPINYSSYPVEKRGTDLVVSPGEMVFVTKNTDAIEKLEDITHQTSRNIERISRDIKELSESLRLEAEARKDISKEVDLKIARIKGALWIVTAIGTGLAGLFVGYLTGLFK